MTDAQRRPDLSRLLSADDAVAYVGGSPAVLREIGAQQVRFGRRVMYDRRDIDARLDARYGLAGDGSASVDTYLDAL